MAESKEQTFWEFTLGFHESVSKGDPSRELGLAALKSISDILGADWMPDRRHPLRSKLMVSSQPNYEWVIHFVRRLSELSKISGYEHVLSHLRNWDTYASALSEMDIALRLKLAGHSPKFAFEKGQQRPDLVAEVGKQSVDIEITSLNQPYEDSAGFEALSIVNFTAIQHGCRAGGLWSRPPRPDEFEIVKAQANEAVTRATAGHKLVRLNIPGLLMCYIVPESLTSEIPQQWRGSFVMRTSTAKPKKDRIASKIQEKMAGQLSGPNPSVLVIYDRFSTPDETLQSFNEKELELVVGAFENLAGVILVYPFSAWDPPPPRREDKNGRTIVEYSLPDGESERCVIWRNIMVDHRSVIESIIDCLTSSPANLTKLFA